MKNHSIKLTALTVAMLSSFHASAALYRIVEVTPPSGIAYGTDYKSSFGISVVPETGSVNCFTSSCGDSSYLLSGDTRFQKTIASEPVDGYDLKEEVPFGLDNKFEYDTESEFQSYCSNNLGYSTCDSWGSARWAEKEREDSALTTSYAFTQNSSSLNSFGSTLAGFNNVITGSDYSGSPVGFALSTSTSQNRTTITPSASVNSSYTKVRQWKSKTYDSTVIINAGSVSNDSSSYYVSKAALWVGSSNAPFTIEWGTDGAVSDETKNDHYAQGSIRDFTVDTTNQIIYAVGYNSYGDYHYMSATLFKIAYTTLSDTSSWTLSSARTITDAVITSSDSSYTHTKLTAVNNNKIAIGESKLDNSHAENGAYANKLFVTNVAASSPSATYFSSGTGNIGFTGAGGHANAINNKNEIVGQIDTETSREVNGKPRRKRGFIYPYNDTTNGAIFNNQAWVLDDLTNGGTYSSANNAYRVLSANDINDAGVIAATAIKCPGGYSATTNDSSCRGTEKTVAVQLIPIAGATSSDISARGYETTSVERKGGSFGFLGLAGLFGLLMYRRKK